MEIAKYLKMKKEIETLNRKADRAEGSMQEILRILKDEFDCESIEQSVDLLNRLQDTADELKRKFDKALKALERKYSEQLIEME